MLTSRQKEILSYLKEDEYVTTSYIAQELDLSDKTIRNELKLIGEILDDVVEIETGSKGVASYLVDIAIALHAIELLTTCKCHATDFLQAVWQNDGCKVLAILE